MVPTGLAMFVGAHATMLAPINYYSQFPDSGLEVTSNGLAPWLKL